MIPVNEPLFTGKEKEYLARCIDEKWISSDGPFVRQFESLVAEYVGVTHGVAVCNGTAALEIAVGAVGITAGDEVILPTFTIISCALAVTRHGGIPVLVDVDPDTWTMNPAMIEKKITARTKAIMVVHMYGHPADMDPISGLAKKYGLVVIEDAAEVHGAEYKGKRCGSLGDIACFSFYANKIITTGEGGMVVTNNEWYAERARSLRNLCFIKEQRFLHRELGYNFRMTNLQAALGVAQMESIDFFIGKKREHAKQYLAGLAQIDGLQLPVEKPWALNVYWMFGVVLSKTRKMTAIEFASHLRSLDIDTRPFFYPLHLQPAYHALGLFKGETYAVSEDLSDHGLYLPSGLALTHEQVEHVIHAVRKVLS